MSDTTAASIATFTAQFVPWSKPTTPPPSPPAAAHAPVYPSTVDVGPSYEAQVNLFRMPYNRASLDALNVQICALLQDSAGDRGGLPPPHPLFSSTLTPEASPPNFKP